MRLRLSSIVVAVWLLGLSAPVFARNFSMQTLLSSTTKIANASLKPGSYRFVADLATGEVTVRNEDNGKVVAQVKGEWVNLPEKAQQDTILTEGDEVQEILFAGEKQAVKFGS